MKRQGFDYVPVDPFAQQQALTGKARLSDEDFIKEFGYGISTLFGTRQRSSPIPTSGSGRASPPPTTPPTTARSEETTPASTFTEAVDSGDFTELGGCTKEASDRCSGAQRR